MNEPVFGSNLEGIVKTKAIVLAASVLSALLSGCDEFRHQNVGNLVNNTFYYANNCKDEQAQKEMEAQATAATALGAAKSEASTLTENDAVHLARLSIAMQDDSSAFSKCARGRRVF